MLHMPRWQFEVEPTASRFFFSNPALLATQNKKRDIMGKIVKAIVYTLTVEIDIVQYNFNIS